MPITHGTTNDPEIMFWAENLHSTALLPKSTIAPAISTFSSPSNHSLAQFGTSLLNLNDTLLKSTDSKSEKKDEFECLESFSKSFMLNASAKIMHSSAITPSPAFAELINCSSSTRARM